jgi:NlpC/P60 family putative phage cell wall peptidase
LSDSTQIMSHGPERAAVVAEAITWIGTPYHHHARLKGIGVDCAQILIAVYAGLGLAPEVAPGIYPPDWHLNHSSELYLHWLQQAGAQRVDSPLPGDVAVFKFGRTFSHGAICVEDGSFIHSYLRLGVIRSRLTEAPLQGREVQFWSVFKGS